MEFVVGDIIAVNHNHTGKVVDKVHRINDGSVEYQVEHLDGSVSIGFWIKHNIVMRYNRDIIRNRKIEAILA